MASSLWLAGVLGTQTQHKPHPPSSSSSGPFVLEELILCISYLFICYACLSHPVSSPCGPPFYTTTTAPHRRPFWHVVFAVS